jgi:cytochrome c556
MTTLTRLGLAGTAAAAVAVCFWLAGTGQGGEKEAKALMKKVDAMAEALQKGNKDAAAGMAKNLAKEQEGEVYDVMMLMKPREGKTPGFGVGKVPGEIVPDGIENMIRVLARDTPGKAKLDREKGAYIEMAYRTQAIGTFAHASPPKKDKAKWNDFSKQMQGGTQDFIKAVQSGSPAEVKTAAEKLNNSCNACHSVFRKN